MFRDYQLSDLHVGDEVKAFHPRTLGVIWPGEIVKVGRKMVHVMFPIDGRTYRLNPRYVSEVVAAAGCCAADTEHGNDGLNGGDDVATKQGN